MPLTDIQCRNAKPKNEGKPNKLTDGNGLYLRVEKAGKYWRYDYRFQGKRKTLALGTALTHHAPKKTRFSGQESVNILLYPGGIDDTAKKIIIKI